MDDLLEKVDLIRERMDVGYKEAKDSLDQANGDVVKALIMLEQGQEGESCCSWREVLARGASSKIRLKKGDTSLLEFPVGVGMIGILGMLVSDELAMLGAAGTAAALLSNCRLEIAGEAMADESEEDDHNMHEGVEIEIRT
ncbi:MAG: DUF4342 domain-containing protein [Syntrophaceticus sp.]